MTEPNEWRRSLESRAAEIVGALTGPASGSDVEQLSGPAMAALIDHTVLKAEATSEQIVRACAEARDYRFASVCVNPCFTALVARELEDTDVDVCTVVGFPLGATFPEAKAYEAGAAIDAGATEIDMVLRIGALKAGDYVSVRDDIRAVVDTCHERDALCKVIIETAYLTDTEKAVACLLIAEAGADFCKTSTGFGPAGATVEDVHLMRTVVGDARGVKAAGGVRTYQTAMDMVAAGASRIGASSGVAIVQGAPA